MAVIAGCAASPYDLAERDAATVSADIRRAIDKYIRDANDIASSKDGKTYVDVDEFERVIVFVPVPDPGQPSYLFWHNVRENAVLRKWKDRFALAQELSYRYSYVKILESYQHFSPPYFTAKVKLLLKAISRQAYGGKPKGIPSAPDGYIVWEYGPRSGMYGAGGWVDHLPAPEKPPGKVVTPSLTIDPISQSALDSLRETSPRESEYAIIARMAYDHHKKRWKLDGARVEDEFSVPEWLSWSHGLEGEHAAHVLKPDTIRRLKREGQPAP